MEKVITMYKKRGETPLEALTRLREERKDEFSSDTPLSYAGRLDPMAEGVLLVLTGDENKNRRLYLGLEKEYRCDVLFGWSTDTYDILGKLERAPTKTRHPRISAGSLLQATAALVGEREEKYPPYSSKTVDGKPLHEWAREGRVDDITIPTHTVTVFESALLGLRTERIEKLWQNIDVEIARVRGDFRQKEIRDTWWEHIRPMYGETCDIATMHFRVSTGTYIRSCAHKLGEQIGIPALAFRIIRSRVGMYTASE